MKKEKRKRHFLRSNEVNKFGKVLLTEFQFQKLIENYGEDLVLFAIKLLNDKIICNRTNKNLVNAKCHYQYFRKDGKIINFALENMNCVGSCGKILY